MFNIRVPDVISGTFVLGGQVTELRVLPKSDGRVEVPQPLIKTVAWHGSRTIYISEGQENLILSRDCEKYIDKVLMSDGRIRIPMRVLRKMGLHKKPLLFSVSGDNIIASTPSVSDIKPALFVLSETPLIVSPIRLPFRFFGALLSTKEIVICSNNLYSYFYLLPVIKYLHPDKRPRYDFGYLLLTHDVFSKIAWILNNKPLETSNFIIWKMNSLFDYKVFLNPPIYIPEDVLKKGNNICSDTESFLHSCFRTMNPEDVKFIVKTPMNIVSQVFCNNNKKIRVEI